MVNHTLSRRIFSENNGRGRRDINSFWTVDHACISGWVL